MAVEIAMFEEGDEMYVTMGTGANRGERKLLVTGRDEEPDRGGMLHAPVLFLWCETLPRRTPCRVEKLEDGRVRFRYEGSDSPRQVHAAWGKADPDWDGAPAE